MSGPADVADLWRRARAALAFTGAGISTESGIPDFRSPGGIWSRYRPIDYREFVTSHEARAEYWRRSVELWPLLRDAAPNDGHRALAQAEERGRLAAVITQNVDDLHQRAGSRRVLPVHGTATRVGCLSCGRESPRAAVQARVEAGELPPDCLDCGGVLKPSVVSFGQPMPEAVMREAAALARECDLFLVVGSSLQVYPAASLPELAVRGGAALVIVNRDETPFDDLAAIVVRASAGEALRAIVSALT